jgi:hypothetical protein
MDYLRVLLVPFRPTSLLLVGVFVVLLTFCLSAGFYGLFAAAILHTWVLKYCYVIIEHLADGATEPPVMDADMLSPLETRPWLQAALMIAAATLCVNIGGAGGMALGAVFLLVFPASVALLGMGDNVFQAINPLAWWRVIRGLGPLYLLLLVVLAAFTALCWALSRVALPAILETALFLLCEVGFFGLIGSCIWLRRHALGFEPSRSPERAAARLENERVKERARMLDDVFQQVRIGKHVDATAPLAGWLRDIEAEHAVRDSLHVAEQALRWKTPAALNPIGSTLIRHLLRFGRPDAALSVFEMFRRSSTLFTMDSAPDLRTLAEYAESVGKQELATSMRLETPVHQPRPR